MLRSAIVLNDGEELTYEMLPEVANSAETDRDKGVSAGGVVTPLRAAHTLHEGL